MPPDLQQLWLKQSLWLPLAMLQWQHPSSLLSLVLLHRAWGKPLITNSLSRDLVCQVGWMHVKTSLLWASQSARYPNWNDFWKTSSENRLLQCGIVFLFSLRGLHLANFNAWGASDILGFTLPPVLDISQLILWQQLKFHSQNYLQTLTLFLLQAEGIFCNTHPEGRHFTSKGCNIRFVPIHNVRKQSSFWSICMWVHWLKGLEGLVNSSPEACNPPAASFGNVLQNPIPLFTLLVTHISERKIAEN